MKRIFKQVSIALRWYRMGVTWRKAWYLAKTQYIRQEQYKAEALVIAMLFAGYAATRRAIVRAAAEIGKAMEKS